MVFFVEVFFVFDFIIQSQFTKYYILQCGLHSLNFLFFPWSFCKNFNGFQFYPSIQTDGIMYFNLVLIVLISNFFVGSFLKVIILFNFTLQLQHFYFIFLCQFWSSFFLIFFILLLNWFFFNFTLQLNTKFIFIFILIFIFIILIVIF